MDNVVLYRGSLATAYNNNWLILPNFFQYLSNLLCILLVKAFKPRSNFAPILLIWLWIDIIPLKNTLLVTCKDLENYCIALLNIFRNFTYNLIIFFHLFKKKKELNLFPIIRFWRPKHIPSPFSPSFLTFLFLLLLKLSLIRLIICITILIVNNKTSSKCSSSSSSLRLDLKSPSLHNCPQALID